MKNETRILLLALMALALIWIAGCSDKDSEKTAPEEQASKGHVWKAQTDTIGEAKKTQQLFQESLNAQEAAIERERQ